jgi:lipoate-protein ligase A
MTDYPLATWRLLITPPADGATNMAIDEAILYALADGVGRPTLRFFEWDPPCLSLGYNQRWAEVDEAACARLGYTWVRRPTGGRAILHTDELTYSVVVPAGEPRVAGGVVDAYRRLSAGLLSGLRALGVDAYQADAVLAPDSPQGAVCFDTPSKYEITAGGKKLIGSAQVRRQGMVLQHGTLPLIGDLGRIFNCLRATDLSPHPSPIRGGEGGEVGSGRGPAPAPDALAGWGSWLLARACTLEEVLGRAVPFQEAAQALARGFAGALNLRLEPGDLTSQERSLAERLRRERYASDAWNRRV